MNPTFYSPTICPFMQLHFFMFLSVCRCEWVWVRHPSMCRGTELCEYPWRVPMCGLQSLQRSLHPCFRKVTYTHIPICTHCIGLLSEPDSFFPLGSMTLKEYFEIAYNDLYLTWLHVWEFQHVSMYWENSWKSNWCILIIIIIIESLEDFVETTT